MMKCPFCQFDNEDGALFCEQCKSDLSGSDQAGMTIPPDEGTLSDLVEPSTIADPPLASAPVAAVVDEAQIISAVAVAEVADDIHTKETIPPDQPSPLMAGMAADTHHGATPASSISTVDPDAGAPNRLPAESKPKLVVLRGQRVNVEYPIYEGDNFIGRADDKAVDIDLEDQEPADRVWSSRQHAVISFQDGLLSVEDLNSTNGTFVNRNRVHPGQKKPLQINDVIQIGTVQLKVRL
jgi:hypothetical protein